MIMDNIPETEEGLREFIKYADKAIRRNINERKRFRLYLKIANIKLCDIGLMKSMSVS